MSCACVVIQCWNRTSPSDSCFLWCVICCFSGLRALWAQVPVAFIVPASHNTSATTSLQDTSMGSEPMVSTIWLPGEKAVIAHNDAPLLTNSMLGGGAAPGQVNLGDSVLGVSPGASMVFAEFKVRMCARGGR